MTVTTWLDPQFVNTTTTSNQFDPHIAVLSDGAFVIVWEDFSSGTSAIRGRIFEADGTARTAELLLKSGAEYTNPFVEADTTGGFILGYTSGTTGAASFRLQAYEADGSEGLGSASTSSSGGLGPTTPLLLSWPYLYHMHNTADGIQIFRWTYSGGYFGFGPTVSVPSDTTNSEDAYDLIELANGNLVALFRDGVAGVQFRIFDSALNPVTSDVTVATLNSYNPAAVALENGGFAIVYRDSSGVFPFSYVDVALQIYAPDGTAYGGPVLVNTIQSGSQDVPQIVSIAGGGVMVLWIDFEGEPDTLKGRIFDQIGNPLGLEFAITDFDPNVAITAEMLPDGRVVVAYEDHSTEGGDLQDIKTIIIDPRGTVITGTPVSDAAVYGNDMDNEMRGLGGNDLLIGMGGDDTIRGGRGNDSLDGGDGNDVLRGGDGLDTVLYEKATGGVTVNLATGVALGAAGSDRLYRVENVLGSDFDDVITGNADANVLTGNDGDDRLLGNEGEDTISGGLGRDTISGGDGDDRLSGDDANDEILGEAGNDTIQGDVGDDVLWGDDGRDRIDGRGHDDEIHGGADNDTLLGSYGRDTIFGDEGNDWIYGGAGTDTVYGGVGDDKLFGKGANDVLYGEDGADRLEGGIGDDTLDGGLGDDTLTGNEDADTFVFGAEIGHDVITDYELGLDAVQISAALWNGTLDQARLDALADTSGPDLVLTFDNGDTLTLTGITTTAGLLDDISLI